MEMRGRDQDASGDRLQPGIGNSLATALKLKMSLSRSVVGPSPYFVRHGSLSTGGFLLELIIG